MNFTKELRVEMDRRMLPIRRFEEQGIEMVAKGGK